MFKILTIISISTMLLTALPVSGHGDGSDGGRQHVFIRNDGQFHPNALYKVSVDQGAMFLENNTFTYHLYDASLLEELHYRAHETDTGNIIMKYHAFKMKFINAEMGEVKGDKKLSHYYNFFIGQDPEKRASRVPGFHEVHYAELYPGIELRMYTAGGELKYDFIVTPGADPADIKWEYDGVDDIKVKKKRIDLNTSVGKIREERPYAYQEINGEKKEVNCTFVRTEKGSITFELDDYDKTRKLIIDPTLMFSSYSGSTANNFGYTATFDARGFLYSGGTAFGVGYPTTTGAYQTAFAGGTGIGLAGTDIVLTKWDTSGTSLIWSTYLGGSSDEMPHSLIVNDKEQLYMLGTTSSTNFPVTPGAYDPTFNADPVNPTPIPMPGLGINYINGSDIVVTCLDSTGSALIGSTYLGGSHNDGINNAGMLRYNYADEARGEILIDNDDNIVVASCTRSSDIPTSPGVFQSSKPGTGTNLDGVIFKLDAALSNLIWATYLGGSVDDAVYSGTTDGQNNIYLSGGTWSGDFPTTPGTVDPVFNGDVDAFVSHLSSDGTTLINSTYRGTSNYDQSYFVKRDRQNNVYIFGQTEAPVNQLIYNAQYNDPSGGQFITKFTPQLDSIIWSTRFGTGDGTPDISPTAFMVDLCNAVYLSGWGSPIQGGSLSTTGLDTAGGPVQGTTDGADFYLMQLADDASALQYATFMGGSAAEHVDGGTSRFDTKGKVYQAVCAGCPSVGQGSTSDFPTHPNPGAYSNTNNANQGCNKAVFKIDFLLPTVVSDFLMPDTGCAPFTVSFDNLSLQQNATSFLWDFGNGDTSTTFEPVYTYNNPGTYIVTLVLTDSLSCNLADTISKTITILQDSTFAFPDITKCINDTVPMGYLSGSFPQGSSFWWSPDTGIVDRSDPRPLTYIRHDTTYYVEIDDGICVDTGFQTIFVDTVLSEAPADTHICSEDTPPPFIGNSFGTGNTFFWSSNSAVGDTLNTSVTDSTFNINPNAGTNTYYFTARNNLGCMEQDSFTVFVTDLDSPLIASFEQPDTGCAPYQVTFTNTSDSLPDTYYKWHFSTGDSASGSSPSYQFNSGGIYTVTLTAFDTGICPQTDTAVLTVSVRTDSVYDLDFRGCLNDSLQVGVSPQSGATYNWLQPGAVSDPGSSNPFHSALHDTTLTLTAQRICTDTFYNHITVDSIFAASDSLLILCSDELPFIVTGTGFGYGTQFFWSESADFSDTLNTDFADSTLTADQDRGLVRYYFAAVSPEGCSDTSSSLVAVSDMLISAGFDEVVCYGDSAVLTAENQLPVNRVDYSWEPADHILTRPDSSSIIVNPNTNTEFRVTTVNDSGCVSRDSVSVFVSNLDFASVTADASRDTIVRSEFIDLFGTPDTGNYTYEWIPADDLDNPNTYQTSAQPQNTTTYTFRVTDAQYSQCNDTAQKTVVVNELICEPPVIYVPNAFTPDGDGLNEKLYVRAAHVRELNFNIYNRWGEKVFETRNLDEGWDGTKDGELVKSGVYVYHLEVICIDDQRYFTKGNITVLK